MIAPYLTLLVPTLLAAGLDLTGRVATPSGVPVIGAHVLIDSARARKGTSPLSPSAHPDCRKRAETDADGRFRIESVDPELIFKVLVIAERFRPEFATKVDPAKGAITVKLAPFDPTRIPANRTLRGVVLDPDGRPLVGARLSPNMFKTEAYSGFNPDIFDPLAVTNLEGEFVLTSKSPIDEADLQVEGNGAAPRIVPGLRPGRNPQRIATTRGATVTGRVVRDGKPVAGASVGLVQANRSGRTFLGSEIIGTDADGRFTFSNVHENDAYFVYGIMDSLADGAVAARPLRVGGDGSTSDVGPLPVVQGHRLKGRVVLSDGKPIPSGTRLNASREDAWDSRNVALDGEGRFEVAGLPIERYSINVDLPGYRISAKNHSSDPQNPGLRLLGTIDADIDGLKILMEPGGR